MALSYFTLADVRALPDMADTAKHSDQRLTAAGEWMEALIEREVGTSFVARVTTETLSGDDQDSDGGLKLGTPWVLQITAVTSNGAAFTAPQLAEVKVADGYIFRQPGFASSTAWDTGVRNIVITYNAGYSATPPFDIKDAALQGTRYRALRTIGAGVSDRATAITNELTTTQLSTAGTDRPTGLPEVDVVIVGWRNKLNLFGFA